MNDSFWLEALKRNWYLVVLVLVFVVAGVTALFFSDEPPVATNQPTPAVPAPSRIASPDVTPPSDPRERMVERTRTMIAAYQQAIDEDPDSAEAPGLMFAMGNLNRQKFMDYAEAARLYELLLNDYPEWEGIGQVYPQLATCYERLGDRDNATRLYKDMMDHFGEGCPEYEFAEAQLAVKWIDE